MMYILTEEEYKALMPRSEHAIIRNNLLDAIHRAETFILKDRRFKCVLDVEPGKHIMNYCDDCPLGYMGIKTCDKEQRYSK